jgi:hypothetical protein
MSGRAQTKNRSARLAAALWSALLVLTGCSAQQVMEETVADAGEHASPLDTDSWPTGIPDGGGGSEGTECSQEGEWEWTEIPAGEDCGPGCTQLTFSESYLEYDQWDVGPRYAAYKPNEGWVHVVDLDELRDLAVPSQLDGFAFGDSNAWAHYPVVYENLILYGVITFLGDEYDFRALYRVDPIHLCQMPAYIEESGAGEKQVPFYFGDLLGEMYVASTDITGIFSDDINDWYNEPYELVAFDLRFPFAGLGALVEDRELFDLAVPKLSSEDIVWLWYSSTGPGMDILRYDMVARQTSVIDTGAEWQTGPAVSEGRLVYTVMPNAGAWTPDFGYDDWSGADIWMYDLETGANENLTDDEFVQVEPDIQGHRVAYTDYSAASDPLGPHPDDGGDIYVIDLDTGVRTRATYLPDRVKGVPRVYGDRVFFIMLDEGGLEQLYMVDLADLGI